MLVSRCGLAKISKSVSIQKFDKRIGILAVACRARERKKLYWCETCFGLLPYILCKTDEELHQLFNTMTRRVICCIYYFVLQG